ncbi:2Fe-2S iron-sulfur cluster binding domain-containing protein [soil metagenome]
MHSAHFRFADGKALTLTVAPGQTVLEAAMAIDAPLRYDCASGSCGACVAQLSSGETEFDADGPSPLSQAEAVAGLRPTCMTRLRGDAVFDLPYALEPLPSAPSRRSARVASVDRVAANVHRLVLRLEGDDDFNFQSGQYVRLRPPGARQARAYSIASAPTTTGMLEFLIRHVPDGMMSTWLATHAKIDDKVALQGPLGAFAHDPRAARHVFLAGGTGLAPAVSILRALGEGAGHALLCFGCATPEDLFYEAELAELATFNLDLEVRLAVMGGEPGNRAQVGTALSLLEPKDLFHNAAYYLCGPPPMIEASQAWLTSHGVAQAAIRCERYIPGG